MDALCERMQGNVSKQAISKYERGLMLPGSDTLSSLSRALQLPVDYFFRRSTPIEKISYRKDYRIPAHSSDQLLMLAQDKMDRYLMLEDLLTINSTFHNPLQRLKIETHTDVEHAAELLRSKWQLGKYPIFSIYEVLENEGIKILELEVACTHHLGLSLLSGSKTPIIVINRSANATVERKRFTALHELGHSLLNFSVHLDEKSRERMCDHFAACVLCPPSVLYKELGHTRTAFTWDELIGLKSRYGISVAAIVHHAKDLNIISTDYYNHLYDQHINRNLLEEGWGGYPIPERTDRFERLLHRAVAEQVISLSRAAELANEKLGDYRETLEMVQERNETNATKWNK